MTEISKRAFKKEDPHRTAGTIAMKSASTSLLLGWNAHDSRTLGFAATSPSAPRKPALLEYADEGHLLTVAPTGAGKGRCAIIPTLLSYTGPVVVIDPKGEAAQVTSRHRREIGHKVVVLDPFHVVTEKSDRLNPFDLFDLDRADAESDSEMIASMLSIGHEFTTDPYWTDTGVGLTAGLIAHIGASQKGDKRTLAGLRELLRSLALPLWESVIMGALTVIVLIAFPRGLAGALSALFDRLTAKRGSERVSAVTPDPSALVREVSSVERKGR